MGKAFERGAGSIGSTIRTHGGWRTPGSSLKISWVLLGLPCPLGGLLVWPGVPQGYRLGPLYFTCPLPLFRNGVPPPIL